MTAAQEIQHWLQQPQQFRDETAMEVFYQKLLTTLGNKDSDMLQAGLAALKASVHASRVKAESSATFQIFPKTVEEQEFLEHLLTQMDIPFKRSA